MNSNINKLHRNIRLDYFFTFINNLNMSSSIWVLYLAYRGMNLLEIGLLEGLFHITSTICEVPSGAIADLWGRKNTLIGGRIYIAISCIIMLFAGIISCLGAISSEKLSKLFKTHITKISAAMIALSILLFSLGNFLRQFLAFSFPATLIPFCIRFSQLP